MSALNELPPVGCVVFAAACVALVGGAVGVSIGQSIERDNAVKAGVGRWVADRESGATEFVYSPKHK